MEGEYKPKGGWFIKFCLGFIAGVALYPLIKENLTYLLVFVILIFIASLLYFYVNKKLLVIVSLICFVLGFIIGCWRFENNIHYPTKLDIDYYLDQTVNFSGEIISEPKTKNKTLELDVRADKFINGDLLIGVVRLRTNLYPAFSYGDKVSVKCRLQAPENTEFNYQRYLARYDIYSLCFNARLNKLSPASNNLFVYLLNFKQKILSLIEVNIGEPESSLVGPILFGGSEEIDDDIVTIFRRTGLTHIMAVSGFNVGILALGLAYVLFAFSLSRKTVFILTVIIVVTYVFIVGLPASAVRAGIMSLLTLYALLIGRPLRFINIIVLTAASTLFINPLLLSADIGWQLSFLALLGLIYYQPILKQGMEKVFFNKLVWLVEILAATIAAQIATIPITLYNFGQVSVISPLANILVVGLIPFFTAVTIIALPLAYLVPMIGNIVFLPSYFIAKYIITVVKFAASFSWATLGSNKVSLNAMILLYVLLVSIVLINNFYKARSLKNSNR
ncbi:MAG: ComEC/Rec2 family competence protein [Candidatus Falkowbacteria bacterium]|nr:ComEC/Rec2 family competence protein [Candidatus Falkowbacteria bacterium]